MNDRKRPAWAERTDLERNYYDTEWGMPVVSENGIFERMSLEVFQSGLSWTTILKRRPGMREAFSNFDVDTVAAFDASDIGRLLEDERIIRNRRKVISIIANAQATVELRNDPALASRGRLESGLPALVWSYRPSNHPTYDEINIPAQIPESTTLAKDLKSRGFLHVGPVTMYALMQAVGIVNDHPKGSWRRPIVAQAVEEVLTQGS